MIWSMLVLVAGLFCTLRWYAVLRPLPPQKYCQFVDAADPDPDCLLPAIDYERGRDVGACLAQQVVGSSDEIGRREEDWDGTLEISRCL